MLPLIQKDVIDKYQMLDKDTFLDYAALSQTLPGIISLNCGIFVGKKVAGYTGAFAAGLGVILPAFVAMLAATILLESLPKTLLVEHIFAGVRSASAALILYSAISLSSKNYRRVFPIALIAISFFAVLVFNVSAYWIIICAALAGLAMKYAAGTRGTSGTGGTSGTSGTSGAAGTSGTAGGSAAADAKDESEKNNTD